MGIGSDAQRRYSEGQSGAVLGEARERREEPGPGEYRELLTTTMKGLLAEW